MAEGVRYFAAGWLLALVVAGSVVGDELELATGERELGALMGYDKPRFFFQPMKGNQKKTQYISVKSITVDPPTEVSVTLLPNKPLEGVLLKAYSNANLVLVQKDGAELVQSITKVKRVQMSVDVNRTSDTVGASHGPAGDETPVGDEDKPVARVPEVAKVETAPPPPSSKPDVVQPPTVTKVTTSPVAPKPTVRPTGAARGGGSGVIEEGAVNAYVQIISRGEEVSVTGAVKKGVITVMHFHDPDPRRSIASLRQGNYFTTLAEKGKGKIVIRRVIVPAYEAPVCVQYGLQSLPQFWIYGKSGQLKVKMINRFTEGDIEAALKKAEQ